MAKISKDVDWVEDVCSANLLAVASSQNKLYAVGGYTILRDEADPKSQSTALANSHLYALDFSSSVDLEKDVDSIFTSVTRLPNSVPRINWGNHFYRDGSLHLFGGSQTTFPIFLANGSYSLEPRVDISDGLFSYDVSEGKWSSTVGKSGQGRGTPIGQAAKAYDEGGDDGKGVLWMYGGGHFTEEYMIGTEKVGNKSDTTQYKDLWRVPGNCSSSSVTACKETTTTSESAKGRPSMQATMVFVDNGDEGLLVLFGGSVSGTAVSLKDIHVYDISSKTWYTQQTTAKDDDFPASRTEACAVVASARDKSSHNIYVHGGISDGEVAGGVWILSLPTFHWIKSDIGTNNTRAGHTCTKVNEKYMVVYRGIPDLGTVPCDSHAGIKIVDLETLEWVTKTEVSKDGKNEYKVPEAVYKVIGGSATGGANSTSPKDGFVDPALYKIFNTTTTSPFNSTAPKPTGTTSPSTDDKKSIPTRPLIGGLVGALILIAILAGILWYINRIKRKRKAAAMAPVELAHGMNSLQELPVGQRYGKGAEMATKETPAAELSTGEGGAYGVKKSADHEVEREFYSPISGDRQQWERRNV